MTHHPPSREPTNAQRALWAKAPLTVFTEQTCCGYRPDAMDPDDYQDAIGDLICDLLHLAHLHPRMDASALHARALSHFAEEIAQEEGCDCAQRSWYGPYHDTQCPVSTKSRTRGAPDARELLDALQLCEEVLSHFARLDDGTPSVSALTGVRDLITRLKSEGGPR